MADFPIRSLQFKDANNLNFTNIDTIALLAIDNDTRDFTRIDIDYLIETKIISDLATEGISFELKADKYYHIAKDYTTRELVSLNSINNYLYNIIDDTKASCAGCSTTCISVSMSASTSLSCKACSGVCVDGCNSNCGAICSTSCDTICWGTCKNTGTA
jgi:hypothetical protein